jgi:eukaryotic-like serine/threonine-protein kinase
MNLTPGTLIGNYELNNRLGAGGMGEVYFARDIRLGRSVALKFLLPELTSNPDRLRRFKQEARTTSALNHPNIVTLFEVGEVDSLLFLVTEFIDGVTLRRYLVDRAISIRDVLDIAIQTAGALAAAQASGIVHRDIKPENIMRRADGYVKVLDFGLAKLMPAPDTSSSDEDLATAMNMKTDPGSVVGTVSYMSPEQLRGGAVDGRSDIWSLGVVMYEMIAGGPPFKGPSKSDVIAAILREEPAPLNTSSSEVLDRLQSIVSRMLRRNPAERYQTAKDLLNDLSILKQELDIADRLGNASFPSISQSRSSAQTSLASEAKTQLVDTSRIPPARPTSGVDYLLSEIKRHRTGAVTFVVGAAVLALVGLIWFSTGLHRTRNLAPSAGSPSASEIMTTSNVREATISPDGKFIATVAEDGGGQTIRIQQPGNAGESQVLASGDDSYRGLVFSRDSYSIYYLAQKGAPPPALYQVPVLGGKTPRKLIDNLSTPVTLSPDGSQLAFVRSSEPGSVLMLANADGSGARELAHGDGPTVFANLSINGLAWSPDGTSIACPMMTNVGPLHMTVTNVKVADGSMTTIGSRQWFMIGQVGWVQNGSGLVLAAQEKMPPASTSQIWLLSYPGGEAQRLTNDSNFYGGISLTADTKTLITARSVQVSNISIVSGFPENQVSAVAASKNKGIGGLVSTADGRLIYSSAETGTPEIWSMDPDGNNPRQLTFDKRTSVEPAVPRAGADLMAFAAYGAGEPHIWTADRSGANLRQLTNGSYEDWPDCSPDGQWVVYHSDDAGKDRIWKVPAAGGEPMMLTDKPASHPIISPDGNWIACYLRDGDTWRLAILPSSGGEPVKSFDIPAGVASQWHGARWGTDGHEIAFIVTRGGVSNIWAQPVNNGTARQLTNFNEGQIFAFAWSTDGKRLICVRGSNIRTVVMMKDFLGT